MTDSGRPHAKAQESAHWTLRAVAWQLLAAVAATVAEYALRMAVWAGDRSRNARNGGTA